MDSSLLRQFGQMFGKTKAKFNQRVVIFSFFLVVATIIWYLSKLSHEYSTTLSYPVRFVNTPKGKIMVGEPPRKISLRVKAYGYTLLRCKMSAALNPIEFDFSKIPLRSLNGSPSKQYILTSRARNGVVSQLGSDLLLESIEPDTINFEFAYVVEKTVMVEPDIHVDFERQYMQNGNISIEPKSIILSGPKSILDTITKVKTIQTELTKLNQSVEKKISLVPIHQVGFSERSVLLTVPVEKFTELSIKIPIEVENTPSDISLIVVPRSIEVKCNVVLSKYFSIKPSMFKAVVDYNLSAQSFANKLKVRISLTPESVSIIDFDPKYIEYYIEKP
ncbi:MAG: CdaR family protein [Tenuifilaceae bacterium]